MKGIMFAFKFVGASVQQVIDVMYVHHVFRSARNTESTYLLYGRKEDDLAQVYRIASVPNTHPDPVAGFEVRQSDITRASSRLQERMPWLTVVGVLHTHEDRTEPAPSLEDIDGAVSGYVHGIVSPFYRSLLFYDEHGFIDRFDLRDEESITFNNAEGDPLLGTRIAQSPATAGQR